MQRVLLIARWLLPLGLGLAGAISSCASAGNRASTVTLVFSALVSAALGTLLYLLLHAVSLLVGLTSRSVQPSDHRLRLLELDKRLLLRAIKEIEFDAALKKISTEEADELIKPLRERAVRLLRELDEVKVDQSDDVEQQIDREIGRRLELRRRTASARSE